MSRTSSYGSLVVGAVEGRAAAAGTGTGGVAGVTVELGATVVEEAIVVVVAVCVTAGVVGASTLISGFGSTFGSSLTVGMTVKTVVGFEGRTTMMLGSGAAVGATVAVGTVGAGRVDDADAASEDCASASTAFEVSLSFVCSAASCAFRSSLSFFAASVRSRSRCSRSEDRIFRYVAVIAVPADKIAAPKIAYAGLRGSRFFFVGPSNSSARSSGWGGFVAVAGVATWGTASAGVVDGGFGSRSLTGLDVSSLSPNRG